MRNLILLAIAIALSYVVAVPCVRRMMMRDDSIDSGRAFALWLLWPLSVVFWVGAYVAKVPTLMFPTPQAAKVRQRLRESAARHDDKQFCIGLVTRMIVEGQWLGVMVVAYLQTLIWWSNIGMRIDLHSSRTAPHIYAAISALGVAGGAWFWSKI